MVVNYKEFVDKNNIMIQEEENCRYLLTIPLNNDLINKTVLVIMKNPSHADNRISDITINNVLDYCYDYYSKVYIANLYPVYETDATKLKSFIDSNLYLNHMKRNFEVINAQSKIVDRVIIGWGANTVENIQSNYQQNIQKILDILNKNKKKTFAVRFQKSDNPWHPLNWKKNFDLELYEWKHD